jgi:hypothetical protein
MIDNQKYEQKSSPAPPLAFRGVGQRRESRGGERGGRNYIRSGLQSSLHRGGPGGGVEIHDNSGNLKIRLLDEGVPRFP